MLWTKLSNSLMAQAAMPLYNDPRRAYHNMAHLERMFAWADHFNLPYCEDLDKAIWGHDVILDPHGQNESRSRDWLLAVDPTATKAGDLVMTTVTHQASDDNRLVMLDLADFIDEKQTIANSALIVSETMNMGDHTPESINTGMAAFLQGLEQRLAADITSNGFGKDTNTFKAIHLGMRKTVSRLTA